MTHPNAPMDRTRALKILSLSADFSPQDLSHNYRAAAKLAHPDRSQGNAERFHALAQAFEALHVLEQPVAATVPPMRRLIRISPTLALQGGVVEQALKGGTTLVIEIPPGMRHGEALRQGSDTVEIEIANTPVALIRGDDVWADAKLDERQLSQGGRVAVETPIGRRLIWITAKASARGLVKLVGQGLPARGSHRAGDLFLRLVPHRRKLEHATRDLLQRFAETMVA